MKTIIALLVACLLPLNLKAPEEPPPDKELLGACVALTIIAIGATAVYVVYKCSKCLDKTNAPTQFDYNPVGTLHFQESSNMVEWNTWLITNTPMYDLCVTNWNPMKAPAYARVMVSP